MRTRFLVGLAFTLLPAPSGAQDLCTVQARGRAQATANHVQQDLSIDPGPQLLAPAITGTVASDPMGLGGAYAYTSFTATASYGELGISALCIAENSDPASMDGSGALAFVTPLGESNAQFTDRLMIAHPTATTVRMRLVHALDGGGTLMSRDPHINPTNPFGFGRLTYLVTATLTMPDLPIRPGTTSTSADQILEVPSGATMDITGSLGMAMFCDSTAILPHYRAEGSLQYHYRFRIELLTEGATITSCSGTPYVPVVLDGGVDAGGSDPDGGETAEAAVAEDASAPDATVRPDATAASDAGVAAADAGGGKGDDGCNCSETHRSGDAHPASSALLLFAAGAIARVSRRRRPAAGTDTARSAVEARAPADVAS